MTSEHHPDRTSARSHVWDLYARFYVLEEGTIYPEDRREMGFYRNLRNEIHGDCLEIGAGAGRLARSLLHDSGVTVALEPSETMLDLWTETASTLALRVRGVAESLPLDSGSFDLVVFPYNGLQCIVDPDLRSAAILGIRRVLRPGGCFVLETCPLFATRPLEQNAHRYTFINDDISVTLTESISRSSDGSVTTYDMLYSVEGEDDTRVVLDVAIIDPEDLVEELTAAGFHVDATWGGYDRSSYDHGLSPRFLLRASLSDAS